MNLRDFTVFQTVAAEKSITKASRLLYLTPQGISKIIKNLEEECECQLFIRLPSGLELTESGICFSEYAATITGQYYEMKNELQQICQKEHGVVDLLSAYGIIRFLTPDCLLSFQHKHPDIEFHYREFPDRQVERTFNEHQGNIAFSIAPFPEDLYQISTLESFPVRLLVNKNHPLSQKSFITITDLKEEPVYIESNEFKINGMLMEKCHQADFEPDIRFETCGYSLCRKMVKEEKGISFIVDFIFEDMHDPDLVLIPFADTSWEWNACMLTRKGEPVSPAVRLFSQHVTDWLALMRAGRIKR